MPSQHQYQLSDFGPKEGGVEKDEHTFFYEDLSIMREQWRTRREVNASTAIPPTPSVAKSAAQGPGQGLSLTRENKRPSTRRMQRLAKAYLEVYLSAGPGRVAEPA
ncbi:hypothetical protein K438DRAFT_1767630 [Mycena galopus ATCC 62051]|nr:hypothetical protein K438DRAFT_1767630 [Mycena galopus ATCC 62051]